jgi:cytochrome P450
VIAEMLGVDVADRDRFRHWSDALVESSGGDGDLDDMVKMERTAELLGFLNDQVSERRAEPRDDLLSVLITAEVDGRALENHEVVMYALSVLVAGNETTRHVISGSLAALAEHPDQRAALIAEPPLMADAVEECLRWITPIQLFARTALADTELGGQAVAEGDWVVMLYASANRDEAVWGASAGAFDARREPNPAHVAFGFGEHLCLGAGLARLEARVFLDELLARHPAYEVVGEPRWTESLLVRGMATLPMRLG